MASVTPQTMSHSEMDEYALQNSQQLRCEKVISLPETMGRLGACREEGTAYAGDANGDVFLVAGGISSSKASNDGKRHQAHQDPGGDNNSRTMVNGSNGGMRWIRASITLKCQGGWQLQVRHGLFSKKEKIVWLNASLEFPSSDVGSAVAKEVDELGR